MFAVLMLGGAMLGGCGDDSSGIVIGADAASEEAVDVVADAAPADGPADDAIADAKADAPLDGADAETPDVVMDVVGDGGADVVDAGMDDGATDGGPADGGPTDGGTGDGATGDAGALRGHRATAFVAAGSVMTSPSYRMVSTLGQSTIHQTVMRSTGYRLQGGLVGATAGSR